MNSTPAPGSITGRTSSLFNNPDADLSIISSDGVMFKVYRKHLDSHTAGFPSFESIVVDQQPITLQEPSDVLELLFQFIHPRTEIQQFHQPLITEIEPAKFFAVAEAAEKYIVFGVMNLCYTRIHYELATCHPLETLSHAYKHGYSDLCNRAALIALSRPRDETLEALADPSLRLRWLLYRCHWERLADYIHQQIHPLSLSGYDRCQRSYRWYTTYTTEIIKDLKKVAELPPVPTNISCPWGGGASCPCGKVLNEWQPTLTAKAAEIPKFSEMFV